jgi:hypothetical protein
VAREQAREQRRIRCQRKNLHSKPRGRWGTDATEIAIRGSQQFAKLEPSPRNGGSNSPCRAQETSHCGASRRSRP